MGIFNIFSRKRVADDSLQEDLPSQPPPAASEIDVGMQRFKPTLRTYFYKSDMVSIKRYMIFFSAVVGSFIWWLGPLLGIFLVNPFIELILMESSIITPMSACYDNRLANQTCENDVMVDYYFYNITNTDEWLAGTAPPAYQEVGPYAFKAKEVRYNMDYNSNWTEVEFSYHQYAEFLPESSCSTCTMNATITSINRGYLQFLAASTGNLDPESAVIYQLMPMTLSIIRDSMGMAIYQANPALTPEAVSEQVVAQWTDCSVLLPLMPFLGLTTPYLKDVPLPPDTPGFPYDPELCAYIPVAMQQYAITVDPSQFAAFGLSLDKTATATFLNLAIGQSNSTYLDPLASQFVLGFLTTEQRTDFLAGVAAVSPPTSTALSALNDNQWLLLKGYIASLVPTWGTLVMNGWLQAGGGGLILSNTVEQWLYGFVDPILLTAAQGAAAAAGAPDSYLLTPWLYSPNIGLTFPEKETPIYYFGNVTGQAYNYSMLSYKDSDVGNFHPLIQQKRMYTGKGEKYVATEMLQYRGIPYFNKTWGILNVTGINEGVQFGLDIDTDVGKLTYDSVFGRAVSAQFTGFKSEIKKLPMLLYNLTDTSTAACNLTYYGEWAGNTTFDPVRYQASVNQIPKDQYWALIQNDTALTDYLEAGPLQSNLSQYFGSKDVYRDRCVTPDAFQGMWDMSGLLACPTIYTFPRFLGAGQVVVNSTGSSIDSWAPNPLQHGYALAVEPFTGYAMTGHKTYQVNHMVSQTANLYPNLWVAPGTGAATGLAADFVTVPIFWLRMWWQPEDSSALFIRAAILAGDILYYLLVMSWPVMGWVMFGSAVFILRSGKEAKVRRKELPKIQRSRARGLRITAHEKDMVNVLNRRARGSIVQLPQVIEEGYSEAAEGSVGPGDEESGGLGAENSQKVAFRAEEGYSAWRFERVPAKKVVPAVEESLKRTGSSASSRE